MFAFSACLQVFVYVILCLCWVRVCMYVYMCVCVGVVLCVVCCVLCVVCCMLCVGVLILLLVSPDPEEPKRKKRTVGNCAEYAGYCKSSPVATVPGGEGIARTA